MQPANAALRIHQSVAALAGADDSLEAINTSQLTQGCVVYVQDVGLYRLNRLSTAAASSTVVVPAQGGPGRWFSLGTGATQFQNVSVAYVEIGPNTSVDSPFSILGATSSSDIVVYNLTDSGLPVGVTTGPVRVTGSETALMRFQNTTSASIPAATRTFRMAVLDS